MSKRRTMLTEVARIAGPLAIVAAGVVGYSVFGRNPDVPQRKEAGDDVALVRTVTAKAFDGELDLEIEGVAVPFRQVTLAAEVAGRIKVKRPSVKSGMYVTENELLFEVEPTDYQSEVDRLAAQIAQTDEEIAAVGVDVRNTDELIAIAKAQLEIRQRELQRVKRARVKDSLTQSEVDTAELQRLTAKNALKTLENQKRTLQQRTKTLGKGKSLIEVQQKQAHVNLKRTKIRSKLTGTIVSDLVEQDDYVKKGDPLVRINDTSRAEVACNLRVDELYWVWLQSGLFSPGATPAVEKSRLQIPPTPVEVVFPFQGVEFVWKGRLSRYDGTGLDAKTRTVPCRVLIESPGDVDYRIPGKTRETKTVARKDTTAEKPAVVLPTIFSGMYVRIRIPIRSPLPLTEIPLSALRPGNKVWVLQAGKLHIRTVRVARTTKETVYLRPTADGLTPGDAVVVSPLASVKEGMPAREQGQ